MSEFMSYDPWRNVTSRNGIQGDLLISALQKSIRRGLIEEAVSLAYEMYITSQQFEDKLWRRLQAISVEDIGFGDLSAPVLINTLNQMRQNFPYTDADRPIFFVHAIRYLATAKKDRTSDNLKNIIITEFEYGRKPIIPDFALDMHTEKGRRMGRDFKHFLEEGSKVSNELEVDENYKSRLLLLLDRIEAEKPKKVKNAFDFNTWQA
jgi:replication-associated recombination protein RarA